jgi:hypothetical protein
MDAKTFDRRWVVAYSLVCGVLMIGGSAAAQVSDWSSRVIGGACDCTAQEALKEVSCKGTDCVLKANKCNQATGNATKICNADSGGPACGGAPGGSGCDDEENPTHHDTLDDNCADGQTPCTAVQI